MTLHRPSNVDEPETLREILLALDDIAQGIPVIFPVHSRTRQRIDDLGFGHINSMLYLLRRNYCDQRTTIDRASMMSGRRG